MYRAKYVCIDGTKYSTGGVVVLDMDTYPTFGLILDVLIYDVDDYVFVCEELESECFVEHFACI